MAYKFEITGSALKITDTATLEDVLIPRRVIWYDDRQLDSGYVRLTGLDYAVDNEFKSAKFFQKETILLSECLDANDVVFTKEKFLSFVSTNFNQGGGNGDGIAGNDVTLDEIFLVERDGNGNIIKTISIYDLQVPPESIEVGESIKISDLGQLPAYTTKFDAHKYLMMGYGFDDSGSQLPKVKVFGAQTDFELQPNDSVTETFVTPVDFTITSQQNVIGQRYTLKIFADEDVRFNVIREAEDGGEATQLVDEIIPQSDLSLDGASFDLTPLVDFASNKVYRLVFSTLNGTIQVKGFNAPATNANGVSRAEGTTFIPYIKREKGWVYEEKDVALENGGGIVKDSTPPTDTTKLWFNTLDNLTYFYDTNAWLSEQIFSVEFNDQGATPNNTFLRVGNTVTNDLGIGYNVPFDIRVKGLSFNRAPNTAQMGNYWLYSNTATGTNNAAVINAFNVTSSARGYIDASANIDVLPNKYLAMRWNGNQTNNNIVTLQYRKKHV